MNAYSLDLRERVVAYVEEGHSQAEAARQFKMHPVTVSRWIKLKKTKGSLEVKPVPRSPHKLPLDALEKYVKEHPDAFLREIGDNFNCGPDAVARALKKLGFTRKKTKNLQRKG